MPGSVTSRKRAHAPPPSTRAASYSSCGTVCSPARIAITKNGKPRQTLTAITAGLATFGPPSHGEHQRVLRRLPERAVAEQRRIVLQADPRRIVSTEQFAVKAQPQRA
jgi:hypothetical protein